MAEEEEEIIRFLPKSANGVPVLSHQNGVWRADNSQLGADTPGLQYRKSKDLNDRADNPLLKWNSIIEGTDEGDGWVKVFLCKQERPQIGTRVRIVHNPDKIVGTRSKAFAGRQGVVVNDDGSNMVPIKVQFDGGTDDRSLFSVNEIVVEGDKSSVVNARWKTSLRVGSLVALVASVHFFYIREYWVIHHRSPILYHYIDWSITAPVQVIEFYLILSAVKPDIGSDMLWRLMIGMVVMLAFGYAGEAHLLGPVRAWVGFFCGLCGWAYITS